MSVRETDLLFARGIAALEAFRAEHGHSFVPPDYVTPDGWHLGPFLASARRASFRGALPGNVEAALDALGFDRGSGAEVFAAGLDALCRFRLREGHTVVPQWHSEDDVALGDWRRSRLAERDRGALRGARLRVLERLGMFATPRSTAAPRPRVRDTERRDGRSTPTRRAELHARGAAQSAEAFEHGLAELRAFVEREGHAAVPARYDTPGGYRLGQWCWWARGRRRAGQLPANRIAPLDRLGFVWDPRGDAFRCGLAEFVAAGCPERPPAYTSSGFRLRWWCRQQRRKYDARRLSSAHAAELAAVGFHWVPFDSTQAELERGLAALDQHLAAGSGAWVPMQFVTPDGFLLGSWLSSERAALRAGRRSYDQKAALAERGVTSSYDIDRLLWGLNSFQRYREAHPGRLPAAAYRDPDGFPLGSWLVVRRREARDGRLDRRVEQAFEAEGIDAWTHPRPRQDDDETRFASALAAYRGHVERSGGRPPRRGEKMPDGRDLAVWLMNQKISLRVNRVPEERRLALETAGISASEESTNRDVSFQAALEGLREFVAAHGHDHIPATTRLPDGRSLAECCYRWRRQISAGTMPPDQRATLVAAGLVVRTGRRGRVPSAVPRGRQIMVDATAHLGAHLRAYRASSGVSIVQIAIRLGVSGATVRSIELRRQRSPIKLALVGRIADLIGMDRPAAARLAGWREEDVVAVFGPERGRAA